MGRPKLPPLPGAGDPDSLASFLERWLNHLAVRNFAAATVKELR